MLAKDAFKSFFAKLGDGSEVNASMLATAEEYVCAIYGFKKLKSVNEAIFQMFKNAYTAVASLISLHFRHVNLF